MEIYVYMHMYVFIHTYACTHAYLHTHTTGFCQPQTIDNQCGWTNPCGSYCNAKTSSVLIRKQKETRFITYKAWKLHGTSWASQQGGNRKRAQTWDSVFIEVKSGGLRLQGFLLIGEFEA